jgi:hypothetical protein
LIGSFDTRPGLLGWLDEDTLVIFDALGTGLLHLTSVDGSMRRDLPDPDPSAAISLEAAALSPDGATAAVRESSAPSAPGPMYVVRTGDGAVVQPLDGATWGRFVWVQGGQIVWLERQDVSSPATQVLAVVPPALGATVRATLPFPSCGLRAWAGSAVIAGRAQVQGGVSICAPAELIDATTGTVLPTSWLFAGTLSSLVSVPSPDGKKVAVAMSSRSALVVADPDGGSLDSIVPAAGSVKAIGW